MYTCTQQIVLPFRRGAPVGIAFLIAADVAEMPDPVTVLRQIGSYIACVITGMFIQVRAASAVNLLRSRLTQTLPDLHRHAILYGKLLYQTRPVTLYCTKTCTLQDPACHSVLYKDTLPDPP